MDEILISEPMPIPKDVPTLLIVSPEDVEYVWEEVKPLIEKALSTR